MTGGTGFIGRWSLPALHERSYEVHAICRKKTSDMDQRVFWHELDLFDEVKIAKLCSEHSFTHLLHFAWVTDHGAFWSSLDNWKWVNASLHLARCFAESGGRRMVVAGSCTEYEAGRIYEERTSRFRPKTIYGASKRALYLMLEAFARQTGMEFAWGYLFYLYGPSEHPNRFVPAVIRGLLKGEEIPCSHGNQIRDFLHSKDAGEGFAALLDRAVEGGINIASGRGISLKDLALCLAEQIGGEHLLQFGKLAPSILDTPSIVAEVSRARDELHWQPEISLNERLQEVISWWKCNLENPKKAIIEMCL